MTCQYCNKLCKNDNSKRNHERLCKLNPNKQEHPKGMLGKISHKKGKTKYTDKSLMKASETLKYRISIGEVKGASGRLHTEETKQKLSIIACNRLQKHSKYSKNIEYKPGVILESSYEVDLAKILDQLNIEWIKVRKGYIWNDNGKIRRYIPDFYLPKYDLFLDAKNDFLIEKDSLKIESAKKLNDINIIVLSKQQITKDFILALLENIPVGRTAPQAAL